MYALRTYFFDKAKVNIQPSVRKSIWRQECDRDNLGLKLQATACPHLKKDFIRFLQSSFFLVELRKALLAGSFVNCEELGNQRNN